MFRNELFKFLIIRECDWLHARGNMNQIVAIYSRLSEEDKNKRCEEDESRSIQNQKSMLISYAASQNWEIYQIYSDDDYKGSDRTRPAFNQLLQDASQRKFNIVLCKSQSRFTRELELVEKIIHGDFAEWGIRFVGLADNADTANKGNKKSRQINGLVNEWYLEDLSENIKTVLTDHRSKGMHIGSFALYGYQKDPNQKGHLIIDPEAAKIVKEVFALYASGAGCTQIARILNNRQIPNPTEYKRRKGLKYGGSGKICSTLWQYYTISAMLSNEMYLGNMVQGRYENATYKSSHSRPVPKERWICVEGTHESIIDKSLWECVQNRRRERTKPMCTGELGVFAGKTKCMFCGHTLRTSVSNGYKYFKCPMKSISENSCKGVFLAQRFLERAIVLELNHIIFNYFDAAIAETQIFVLHKSAEQKNKIKQEIMVHDNQIASLKKAVQNLYLDKVNEVISCEEYAEFKASFAEQAQQCVKQRAEKQALLDQWEKEEKQSLSKRNIIQKYRTVEKLDRKIVETLIDYIEIGRCEKKVHRNDLPPIVIHWKF